MTRRCDRAAGGPPTDVRAGRARDLHARPRRSQRAVARRPSAWRSTRRGAGSVGARGPQLSSTASRRWSWRASSTTVPPSPTGPSAARCRARCCGSAKGDTVELDARQSQDSKAIHSIDLHAVTGGHGGGEHTQVAPGQTKTVTFKALNPGLYVYHCATPLVPHHISAGMYGMILVEPEGRPAQGGPGVLRDAGRPVHVARVRHQGPPESDLGEGGRRAADLLHLQRRGRRALQGAQDAARVGETVRIYFGVGGPEQDLLVPRDRRDLRQGLQRSLHHRRKKNVQTTLVAPGGATIVEFKVQLSGQVPAGRPRAVAASAKGLVGALEVTGRPTRASTSR